MGLEGWQDMLWVMISTLEGPHIPERESLPFDEIVTGARVGSLELIDPLNLDGVADFCSVADNFFYENTSGSLAT